MKSRYKQNSVSHTAPLSALNGRRGSILFLSLAILFLVIGLVRPSMMSGPRMGVADMAAPVLSFIGRPFQSMASAVNGISGRAALKAENTKLKAENDRLRQWYQTALMLSAENQSLQKLLNLKINMEHHYVTSRVISDAGSAFVKTVLVQSGADDGVHKNQAVMAGDGMIGRVIEAGDKAARVMLLTDINSHIPVIIEGSNQKAILVGDNSDYPILKHMPKDSGLSEGARIVTSGDGGVFPFGLPVGTIITDGKGDKVIRPFADLNRITYVRIISTRADKNLMKGDLSRGVQ